MRVMYCMYIKLSVVFVLVAENDLTPLEFSSNTA